MVILLEACAGSAALSRRVCGLGRILGYAGSKDRYADDILHVWGLNPSEVDVVWLNDPGPWGLIWHEIVDDPGAVADALDGLVGIPAKKLWERLVSEDRWVTQAGPSAAANWICRLAGTYGGFEDGGFKGAHIRRPKVDGYVPCRKSLAERVRRFQWPLPTVVTRKSAVELSVAKAQDLWVYIDPPYAGRSGYRNRFPREDVLDTARRFRGLGARVAVSEGVSLGGDLSFGWRADRLNSSGGQCRRNSTTTVEWLTYTP